MPLEWYVVMWVHNHIGGWTWCLFRRNTLWSMATLHLHNAMKLHERSKGGPSSTNTMLQIIHTSCAWPRKEQPAIQILRLLPHHTRQSKEHVYLGSWGLWDFGHIRSYGSTTKPGDTWGLLNRLYHCWWYYVVTQDTKPSKRSQFVLCVSIRLLEAHLIIICSLHLAGEAVRVEKPIILYRPGNLSSHLHRIGQCSWWLASWSSKESSVSP